MSTSTVSGEVLPRNLIAIEAISITIVVDKAGYERIGYKINDCIFESHINEVRPVVHVSRMFKPVIRSVFRDNLSLRQQPHWLELG
jgi:hypothetical protein